MSTVSSLSDKRVLAAGQVVALGKDMAGVQVAAGSLVPADKLGPGWVEQTLLDGSVCVRWPIADIEACLPNEDLQPMGPSARLIIVRRYDKRGVCLSKHHKVVSGLGLAHNWVAELRPAHVVRIVRTDGPSWTFTVNPVFRTIRTQWELPRDDDDAEALTVAELTL